LNACSFKQSHCALSSTDGCYDPVIRGPCHTLLLRYAYNPETKECAPFVYSGCGGSRNNFETRRKCRRTFDPGRIIPYSSHFGKRNGHIRLVAELSEPMRSHNTKNLILQQYDIQIIFMQFNHISLVYHIVA
uniref:BPTI/Kunitz inhibitor domain-containing protein n=1 Tax=Echinostoma caproni TaxID=27848 RepID=A0A183BBK6_9TREM